MYLYSYVLVSVYSPSGGLVGHIEQTYVKI